MKPPTANTRAAWTAYAVTILLLIVFTLRPAGRIWSFNWYNFLPWYALAAVVTVATLALWWWTRRLRSNQSTTSAHANKRYWQWAGTIIGLSLIVWVALSARTHFLGDGSQLLARLQAGSAPIRPWNVGAYFLVDTLYALLGGKGEPAAEWTFRLIAYLSGVLFLIVIAWTAAKLFQSLRQRLLFLAGLATGGYALLFFGYVENYPPFVCLAGAIVCCGLLVTEGRLSRWWILLPTALAALFHPYTVAFVPAVAYLLLRKSPVGRTWECLSSSMRRVVAAAFILTVLAALFWAYRASLFLQLSLVPWWHNRFTVEGYTLFSGKHLLDFANLLVVLLPALAIAVWAVWSTRLSGLLRRPAYVFLLLATGVSLAIAFLFDPKLGMPRDWDIFAFAGTPLAALLFYRLLDTQLPLPGREAAAAAAVVLGAVFLLPRATIQVIPDASIALFDSYSQLDTIKTHSGRYVLLQYLRSHGRNDEADRREAINAQLAPYEKWDLDGFALLRHDQIDEAEALFRKVIATVPTYSYSWSNLGMCFIKKNQWDSALVYLKIADGLNPFNSNTYNALGFAYLNLGREDKAEDYFKRAIYHDPHNFTARGNLVRLYTQQRRRKDLVNLLLDVVNLDSLPYQTLLQTASQLLEIDAPLAASQLCRHALAEDPHSPLVDDLKKKYPWFEPVGR